MKKIANPVGVYDYSFYGLRLISQIEMPELPVNQGLEAEETIQICWGSVEIPEDRIVDAIYKPDSVVHRDFYYLNVEGIAYYFVNRDNVITVERQRDGSDRDIVAFLLDTVLSVVLIKCNKYIFHASAITSPTGAIMLCGNAGIGKSAMALKLLSSGYNFLEDDRCMPAYNLENQKVYLKNHMTFLDIWRSDRGLLDRIKNAVILGPVRKNIQKLRIDVSEYVSKNEHPIYKVLILRSENIQRSCKIEEIKGINKFRAIKHLSHMGHLIPQISDASKHFKEMANLLSTVPVYVVTRSSDTLIDEFAEFIVHKAIEHN